MAAVTASGEEQSAAVLQGYNSAYS